MKPKKAIKELRKQLRGDPANVVLRIRLASLLRDVGSHAEAVENYLSVAQSYQASGRTGQALAVCKGVLEFAPQNEAALNLRHYLESQRQLAEMDVAAAASLAPLPEHSHAGRAAALDAEEGRRKRPTSMPTPLTDRGSDSMLPGLRTTSTGTRQQRATDSMILSARRPVPDNTVPGEPHSHVGDSQRIAGGGFRLQDLNQAASMTPSPDGSGVDSELNISTVNRLPPTPPLRLPPTPPPPPAPKARPARPAPPAPPVARRPSRKLALSPTRLPEPTVTKQFPRAVSLDPPTLEPPPTPTPPDGHAEEGGAELEDATIVDANFDLAAFMAAEQEAKEEDLPDLPSAAPAARSAKSSQQPLSPAVPLSAMGPLQGLPRYALDALLSAARVQAYPDGAMVVSEGQELGACRVVRSGELHLLKNDPVAASPALVRCGSAGPGELVGASAFMSDRGQGPVIALGAAVASGPVEVVEIPIAAFEGLRQRFPAAGSTLELFYRDRCSDLLMRTSSLFDSMSGHDQAELMGMFEPVRAAEGQAIISVGGRVGGFYLVLSGSIAVQPAVGRGFSLEAGGFFGDVAVVQGHSTAVTVRATRSTEMGRLDARRLYELISGHPQVWAEIWRQSGRPEVAAMQLVAGTSAIL